jgi:hypothetical protein
MKKILLLLAVSAVLVLLVSPDALARQRPHKEATPLYTTATAMASPTATATATASATASPSATASATASPTATASALPTTAGPPLVGPLTLVATLTLIASGVGAVVLLRGGGAVS